MPISAPPKWTEIKNKPTTMAGFGITDEKCRAWVNFNGTNTVAIRASGNVSSITDNGTGDYTVNFTNAMPDANYICVFGEQGNQIGGSYNGTCIRGLRDDNTANKTANSVRVGATWSANNSFSQIDPSIFDLAVFR